MVLPLRQCHPPIGYVHSIRFRAQKKRTSVVLTNRLSNRYVITLLRTQQLLRRAFYLSETKISFSTSLISNLQVGDQRSGKGYLGFAQVKCSAQQLLRT